MTRLPKIICAVAVLLYLCVSCFYFLSKPAGIGDEALFISDLNLIFSKGWIAAIEKGISIPYMALTYLPSLIFEDYIALRLTNIILFIGLLGYFYYRVGIKNSSFYTYLLFFYSTVGFFLLGTNDTLFTGALVIFIVECYTLLTVKQKHAIAWLVVALLVAIFTRALVIVFIPMIILALLFMLKWGSIRKSSILIPIIFMLVGLLVNIPSLKKNNTLSYDQKDPPKEIVSTWEQRQYLTQLLVNKGKLKGKQHPSWEETDAYLNTHGAEALPNSMIKGMLHDPLLTTKEFFKELLDILKYGTRQLGLILPALFFFGFMAVRHIFKPKPTHFIPLVFLGMCCVFSVIIISYIELRWLAPIFIAGIFYFYQLQVQRKLPLLLMQANYAVICLLSLYGVYGLLVKM